MCVCVCVCVYMLVYIKEVFGALLFSSCPRAPMSLSQENSGSEGLPHHVVTATSAGRSDVINNLQLKYLIIAGEYGERARSPFLRDAGGAI